MLLSKLLLAALMVTTAHATCDGSAITETDATRTGGSATNGPTGTAGATEADDATIIFTCDYGAGAGAAAATNTWTCDASSGLFTNEGSAVSCPAAAAAPTCDGTSITEDDAARTGGTASGTPPAATGATEASGLTIIFTCTHAPTVGGTAATSTYTCNNLGVFTEENPPVTCPASAPVAITGMCTGNTGGTGDVDCSGETTNTVNKGAAVTGTDVATCCEAPITGMCTGNTGGTGDVDCSGETTNTVNKGASVTGTDAATCCEAPAATPSPATTTTTTTVAPSTPAPAPATTTTAEPKAPAPEAAVDASSTLSTCALTLVASLFAMAVLC